MPSDDASPVIFTVTDAPWLSDLLTNTAMERAGNVASIFWSGATVVMLSRVPLRSTNTTTGTVPELVPRTVNAPG